MAADPKVVLVAEDDGSVRKMIRAMLQASGYRVLEATDGQQALSALRSSAGKVDLLVTDIRMPNMSGLELYAAVIAERPEMKILIISAMEADRTLPEVPFLHKPFRMTALQQRVHEILNHGRPAPAPLVRIDGLSGTALRVMFEHLRLTVEQQDDHWRARVYETAERKLLYEAKRTTLPAAKTLAVEYALVSLHGPAQPHDPARLAESLLWERS